MGGGRGGVSGLWVNSLQGCDGKSVSHKALVFLSTLTARSLVPPEVKLVIICRMVHWGKSFISPSSTARHAVYYIGQLVYIVSVS